MKLFVLTLAAIIVGTLAGRDPGQSKLDRIRQLEAESANGVIEMTAQQYL